MQEQPTKVDFRPCLGENATPKQFSTAWAYMGHFGPQLRMKPKLPGRVALATAVQEAIVHYNKKHRAIRSVA